MERYGWEYGRRLIFCAEPFSVASEAALEERAFAEAAERPL